MKSNARIKNVLKETVFYLVIIIISLGFVAPIIWMMITSLQPYKNLMNLSDINLADSTLNTYKDLFAKPMFVRALKATIIVTVFSTVATVIVSIMSAYASAFFNFKGKDAVIFGTLSIQMAPAIILIIPLYIILIKMNISGSYLSLIAIFVLFMAPMTAWMMRGFFRDIPRELFDSARVDGCTKLEIIYKIILPITRPGIAACSIFTFITAWNEVLIPLIVSNSTTGTLTMFVATYATQYKVDYGGLAASGIFTSIPGIILVILFNKQLIDGLVEGAVKG